MLCDGDSISYDATCEAEVQMLLLKEDCVNHVSKRMGTALRNVATGAKVKWSSLRGKGKLTEQKILKMHNY